MLLRVSLLLSAVLAASALPSQQPRATCGYQSCPAVKPGMLNVHLVPHTHDDVGWLKTVDQYFYGHKNKIQKAGVQYIIDSVIVELQKDPSRRFIYVETAFFWQWWLEQDEGMRDDVRALVNSGQLEFISGGWSMNDEAVTHYQSVVDQLTWGLRKLNETFGDCGRPRIGWQIDPFGHSREMASILAHLGFDGLFFARLDVEDFDKRKQSSEMEVLWEASQNQGDSSTLFTSILYYFYSAPPTFCFDLNWCNDEPIIDNTRSPDYNTPRRTQEFIDKIRQQAESFTSGNIMFTMGGDFNYQQADTWFKNMDLLIKYINMDQANNGINLLYSTPSCYVKAVNEAGVTLPTKQDDFFPYSSDPHSFWSGYYTSRPTQKYFERKGNTLLQVCKQLHVLAGVEDSSWESLDSLREVMGVMQHHDAITGTEKQHVADDYALRLSEAFDNCQLSTQTALNKLMAVDPEVAPVPLTPCLLSNVSQCDVTESSDVFVVTLYNPLAHDSTQYPRLPVTDKAYQIFDPQGVEVVFDKVPIPASVLAVPGRVSSATHDLVFKAADLPPLGFKSYYVTGLTASSSPALQPVPEGDKFSIGTAEGVVATLEPSSGLLRSLNTMGRAINVTNNFLYYTGFVGDNSQPDKRSSGAYIFRPAQDEATLVSDTAPQVTTFQGAVVHEVHQVFSDWVSQVIRTYPGEDYTEFEWLVGPIPTDNVNGKEVISRFTTDWSTQGKFYTDSNGRERLERVRDFRPTWEVNLEEKVAGNYYPVTTAISLQSDSEEFSLLTDRAQGGASLRDGELELMVHRRLHHDDAFGVGEALNEMQHEFGLVSRGRHIVVLGSLSQSPTAVARQRQLSMQHMVLPAWVLLTPTSLPRDQWVAQYKTQWSGMTAAMPDNAHLLTLEPWKNGDLLVRLEHMYEQSDDPTLGQDTSVELEGLMPSLGLALSKETTLGGNQWLEDNSRLSWSKSRDQQLSREAHSSPSRDNRQLVELQPMQIRTFVVTPHMSRGVAQTSLTLLVVLAAIFTALLAN